MKYLIIGSSGMLGTTIFNFLKLKNYHISCINRTDIDLCNCSYNNLKNEILTKEFDVIINCSGIIKQRKDIKEYEYIAVNSLIPLWIEDICIKNKKKFIHVTTDCVYSGKKGNYSETDTHDADDIYGKSKSLGEPKKTTVIRTSIIGEDNKNLSLMSWAISNKDSTINGFLNHYWNGVTCYELSKIIEYICKNNLFWEGVRHFYSNKVSKYELLAIINNIYNLNINIVPISTEQKIDRALSSNYNLNNFNICDIKQQILESKNFYDLFRGYP